MAGAIEGAPAGEMPAAEVSACGGQKVGAAEEVLAEQCDGLSTAKGAPVVGIAVAGGAPSRCGGGDIGDAIKGRPGRRWRVGEVLADVP